MNMNKGSSNKAVVGEQVAGRCAEEQTVWEQLHSSLFKLYSSK